MDLCVGERPKPVGRGALEDFNAVFLTMFKYLEDHERIVTVWHGNHEEDPLSRFGSMRVGEVRRWLKYNQLVTVKKDKEIYPVKRKECFGKYDSENSSCQNWYCGDYGDCRKYKENPEANQNLKTMRARNITIIRPTKRGEQAYENGLVIKVDWGSVYASEKISVGIGKPYPASAQKIYEIATNIWHRAKISMSRQDKWWPELREQFLMELMDKKTDEASQLIGTWAGAKAWDWNTHHRGRKPRIKDPYYQPPENQRRLFDAV